MNSVAYSDAQNLNVKLIINNHANSQTVMMIMMSFFLSLCGKSLLMLELLAAEKENVFTEILAVEIL